MGVWHFNFGLFNNKQKSVKLVYALCLFLLLGVVQVRCSKRIEGGMRLSSPTLPAHHFSVSVVHTLVDVGLGEVAIPAPADDVSAHDPHEVTLFYGHVGARQAQILRMHADGALYVEKHLLAHHDLGDYFLWVVVSSLDREMMKKTLSRN
jgi:hypothetical protein